MLRQRIDRKRRFGLVPLVLIASAIFVMAAVWFTAPASSRTLAVRLAGTIALDVETNGEAWYIYPDNLQRYYLGRPSDAFAIMRSLGLGITNADLEQIPTNEDSSEGNAALRSRLAGKILLQVEAHGEAWYIYPDNLRRYYLGRPEDAFALMSSLGLGISRTDLATLPIAEDGVVFPPTEAFNEQHPMATPEPEPTPEPTAEPTPNPEPEPVDTGTAFPLPENCEPVTSNSYFYRDTTKNAVKHEQNLRAANNTSDAALLREISCYSQAVWLVGGTPTEKADKVRDVMAGAGQLGKVPVFTIYNVPDHFTLNWRSGVGDTDAYRTWITAIAEAIGSQEAWIVYEPDTINLSFDYLDVDREARHAQLQESVQILKSGAPNAKVYLDGGHSSWRPASTVAQYLLAAGLNTADGFTLNVSNFRTVDDEIAYGTTISNQTGGKRFLIDTSRNGNGPDSDNVWCNPSGRALGPNPTRNTGHSLVDAFLWVKSPGESDDYCNGGPAPGKYWLDYALNLVRNRPE